MSKVIEPINPMVAIGFCYRQPMSTKFYDWTKVPPVVEEFGPSVTEPNQVYTNEELVKMHIRGVMPNYDRSAVVLPGESDGFNPEEVRSMDRIDRERWSRETLLKAAEQEKVRIKAAKEQLDKDRAERVRKNAERKLKREQELLDKLEQRQKGVLKA